MAKFLLNIYKINNNNKNLQIKNQTWLLINTAIKKQQQRIVDLKPKMAFVDHCNNSVDQRPYFYLISIKLTATTRNFRFETNNGC